jgi:hypothetical protein
MMLLSGFDGLGYFAYRGMTVFIFLRCVVRCWPKAAASAGSCRVRFRRQSGLQELEPSRQLLTQSGHSSNFDRTYFFSSCDSPPTPSRSKNLSFFGGGAGCGLSIA